MKQSKLFRTKYGYFSADGSEYVITTPTTPRPWINVISNGDYGLTFSQTGSGYSWRTHAQLNRLTRWEQDLIKDEWGKYIYLRDEKSNIWSAGWKPVCNPPDEYACRHGIGYSVIESVNFGIATELLLFVPEHEPLEVWRLAIRNRSRRQRTIKIFTYLEWGLGAAPDSHREFHRSFIESGYDRDTAMLSATKRLWEVPASRGHWNKNWDYTAFHSSSVRPTSFDSDKESFLGMYGNQRMPAAVLAGRLAGRSGRWLDPCASMCITVRLRPAEEKTVCFTLGAAGSAEEARTLAVKYHSHEEVDRAFEAVRRRWNGILGTVRVRTPDAAMNVMENTWLKYQAISGRLWARTAFYQTGGAIGFRDQLQDSQIFLTIDPSLTRRQILLHARHQFADGGVYHWWHPISEIGLRNAISDNLLWLPFVVNSYLQETADRSVLDVREPFVDETSGASLYDHCTRAIDRVLTLFSPRGLPLIGGGDWNDGLSAVGLDMKGESVWLGHFLHRILLDFSAIALDRGDESRAKGYTSRATPLKDAINRLAWDGSWYYRATRDTGEKIGSKENAEGRIFLNAQTWAVISGVADGTRSSQVMDAVESNLEFKAGPVLLYPSYKNPDEGIGYLSRYAPGVRENGGVYTHAATWAVIAEAMLGRGDRAFEIYSRINPVNRGTKPDEYCAEPYVTPGNIDGPESAFYGRGGWTWYTGSAAWLFKAGLEWILGIRPALDGLIIDPCIPPAWDGFGVTRMFRGAAYTITVENPDHVSTGVKEVFVDGTRLGQPRSACPGLIPPFPPGSTHVLRVLMGKHEAEK